MGKAINSLEVCRNLLPRECCIMDTLLFLIINPSPALVYRLSLLIMGQMSAFVSLGRSKQPAHSNSALCPSLLPVHTDTLLVDTCDYIPSGLCLAALGHRCLLFSAEHRLAYWPTVYWESLSAESSRQIQFPKDICSDMNRR